MTDVAAFVGDVHGNLAALNGLYGVLAERECPHIVFLGDYINKGPDSRSVLERLLSLSRSASITLLQGNHEAALLDAVDRGDLAPFLKMGGAVTIRSYVGGDVGPDVLSELRANIPTEHLEAIRGMQQTYESDDVIAQHSSGPYSAQKYRISAHLPVGTSPRIGRRSAQLDTGCGAPSGRLTAFLWPSRRYMQVDADGALVHG